MQSTQCISCKHYIGGGFCEAFGADPIPKEISIGWFIHKKPYKGDNGFRYERSEEYQALRGETS
ncbi:MAG: hypothetical protein COA86_02825 [Kangiella sp.]|nr:MAG: hypothetical protein COA86_02825 [Kangiella sp.]